MDSLTQYRQIIKRILTRHTKIPYSFGDLQSVTVFDTKADRYLLLAEGWEKRRRIHDCLIHIAIIDGKIWIQEDGTEYGVAQELLDAGIPKDKIVLGFKSPALRKYTEFAVA